MGVYWDDVDVAYARLQNARSEGQTSILMRLTEMQLCISEAIDAHVREIVVADSWSWQRVADALGVSRQAASKRWTHKVFPGAVAVNEPVILTRECPPDPTQQLAAEGK